MPRRFTYAASESVCFLPFICILEILSQKRGLDEYPRDYTMDKACTSLSSLYKTDDKGGKEQ